jgi:exopolysaccharide biosynthesis polyprenyl glycosylphosphotransferase
MISYLFKFDSEDMIYWYVSYGLLLTTVSALVFKNSNLYDALKFPSLSKEASASIKANLISLIIFLVIAFFMSHQRASRVVLVIYFILSSSFLILSKVYFRKILAGIKHRVLIIGTGKPAKDYIENLKDYLNIEIVNWWDNTDPIDSADIESMNLNDIIIGFSAEESKESKKALDKLSNFLVPIVILPDVSFAKVGYSISEFKGQPLIYLNEPNVKQSSLIIKRTFDFCATFVGVLLISPILAFIAVAIKLTSKGPVLYNQVRMGVDGREFKMWKFRSMITGDANHGGWTVENDPRVTKIGRFIRRTNLDELPQLWNVLTGDMSLVGPRPERPQYVEKFRKEIPGYMIRHKFKAGVTGWAQVNGWRGDTSIPKRIECDLWYIKNWSLYLDISILFMTFFKGNKNAY